MLNLKKTAVAVLAFGSTAVFAGTMGPVCAPGNVTVPCEATAWDFGAQALYLQPTYAVDGAHSRIAAETNNGNLDWGWGFQIEGSYHFNTGNDVDLNWYHYSQSNNHTDVFNAVNYLTRVKPQWDAVNLEVGQHVDFSQFTKVRMHAGAQYARIKTSMTNTVDTTYSHTESYNGFGPRMGVDMAYDIGNGLAVYGKTAGTVLAGSTKFTNSTTTYENSRTVIVPALEGKLGAKYTYAMASGDLTLDVGYMWMNYFNARTMVDTAGAWNYTDDFGLNGLYFGLKWLGNVA